MDKFKKVLNAFIFVILFLWQLPQNIVALIMMPFIGKLTLISYKKYCFAFKGEGMSGGISLGNFAFLDSYSAKKATTVAHEQEGHTVQSKILGPLYLFVIGIPSIIHTFHKDCPCYYHFYTESWANKCAGLEVLYTANGRCFLSFKDALGVGRKRVESK
jgi:hypothetical protein